MLITDRHLLLIGIGILAAVITVMIIPADASVAIGDIPPTRAFQKIFVGLLNVTANKYNANLNLTGYGITITPIYENNTIQFSVDGTGSTGNITGAANVGSGTGLIYRNQTAGILQLRSLVQGSGVTITNNANDITISATGTSGITAVNNFGSGTAQLVATNSSNKANIKSLLPGRGITLVNGTSTITINAPLKVANQTVSKDFQIVGINNNTGIITTNQFSINNGTYYCAAGQYLKGLAVGNTTGYVTPICQTAVAGGGSVNTLAANVTASGVPSADTLIFTIPLTANSGNVITGQLSATSGTTGNAVQVSANVTSLQTRGYCHFVQVSTTSADSIDNIVMNTVLTGRATNTGETAWIAAANVAEPIKFECSLASGATPGNLKVYFNNEIAATSIAIKAGSYYIKSP